MNTHYDRNILIDYLHGALEPATDAAVFAHLEVCNDCRAARNEETAIADALRAFARETELELPSMVKARVWDAIRHEKPSLLERLRSRWAPALAVPVAAALALAAYFGTPIMRQPGPTGVAASFFLDEHNAEATQNPLGPGIVPASYSPADTTASASATYIDTADAATLDSADGAVR
ncbi:MAG TPA: zf-HC2 domain-containing protein [Candidatus Elarobacter sp.]|jgi:hypothetical protein